MRSVEQMGCCCCVITERGCSYMRSVMSTTGHGGDCLPLVQVVCAMFAMPYC
jgi:hypothetical protein